MTRRIEIAAEFSLYPYGRTREHGDYSGQRFREEFLMPALRAGGDVTVSFDRVRSYSSSFLEEAFGGLVREGFSEDTVLQRIKIEDSDDPTLKGEIEGYVRDAARAAA